MSCGENVIAMRSSSNLKEESVKEGAAANVMQPHAVAGRTAGVAEETVDVSVNVAAQQVCAGYAEQRRVVQHGVPSAEEAEPKGWTRKRNNRQSASPWCSVAGMHADERAVVFSRARKLGG